MGFALAEKRAFLRQSIASHVFSKILAACLALSLTASVFAQSTGNSSSAISGSVASGPASSEVLHLTLRDAVNMALRYNLGQIESSENVREARGERLRALSLLLPQVSVGLAENVEQLNTATLGIKSPTIPRIVGPFSYSSAQASASQTLFSYQSIQRFRGPAPRKRLPGCRTTTLWMLLRWWSATLICR